MPKAMLVSVGGSIEPIVYALNEIRPMYIIFFASAETKENIQVILEKIQKKPKGIDQIISPSAEVLSVCYRNLIDELSKKLKTWAIEPRELVVDYTGGTKTMSAALLLATIELGCTYSYVGGIERNKGGTGVVIDGKERMLYYANPWNELAVAERKSINLLFNTARYTSARERLEDLLNKVSQDARPFYEMVLDLVKGYELWDRFSHKDAHRELQKGLKKLRLYTSQSEKNNLAVLADKVEENITFLTQVQQGEAKKDVICDLIANARRRAELENKYDDAVARLYRALEKLAQVELLSNYRIKTSDINPEKLPQSLREEYKLKYTNQDGKIKTPLWPSYRILKEKNGKLGKMFFENEREIKSLLDARNSSILAHGDRPVKRDLYERLFEIICQFAEVRKDDPPSFPKLNI